MCFNINLPILKNQQKSFELYKSSFGECFSKSDLVTIETKSSSAADLEFTAKRLFELFYALSLNGRGIWMSHETIARKLSVCVTTVKRALRYLKKLGLVSWVSGRTDYKTNDYFVHISLLKHEAVRILRNVFQCARLAWYRRLIRFSVGISMLQAAIFTPSVNNDSDEGCLPRNKKLNINKPIPSTKPIPSRLGKGVGLGLVKKKGLIVNVKKEDFQELKAKGFEFNDAARCDLQMFHAEVVELAAKEYERWSTKNNANNPFMVFIKICHRISTEGKYQTDLGSVGAFKAQYGISGLPTMEYIPLASDNYREKLPSNGKLKGSGTLSSPIPDEQGWTYGVMPDGTKVRSRSVEIRSRGDENESPDQIEHNMINYVQSEGYKFACSVLGEEYMETQVKRWLGIAKAIREQDFETENKLRAEIIKYIYNPNKNT